MTNNIATKDAVKAYDYYASGKSYAEIATLMKVHQHYVENLVDRGDILRTSFDLRVQGMKWEEIGKRVGSTGGAAHYFACQYAQATGKSMPSIERGNQDTKDIYELVKKGYSPTLIKALGFQYDKQRLYSYCYHKKLPQWTQEKALKADFRWRLMTQGWKAWDEATETNLGEVLDRKPTYRGEYILSSKDVNGQLSIQLTFIAKDPFKANCSTTWALSSPEVAEDDKHAQRPNWSTACDAVALYMQESIADDDFDRVLGGQVSRRETISLPVVSAPTPAPDAMAQQSASVSTPISEPAPSQASKAELSQKLFKHAASTLDVTDPKTRQFLKDMLNMLGGDQ